MHVCAWVRKRDRWLQQCATSFVFDCVLPINGWAQIWPIYIRFNSPDTHLTPALHPRKKRIRKTRFYIFAAANMCFHKEIYDSDYTKQMFLLFIPGLFRCVNSLMVTCNKHAWQPWAWPWKCHEQMAVRVYDNDELILGITKAQSISIVLRQS